MPILKASSDVYHAIADANRRRLLDFLASDPKPVGDCVAELGITYAAVSQHLRILLEVGLVDRRTNGKQRFYRSTLGPLQEVHDWTANYRKFWTTRLKALGDYLDHKECLKK